MTSETVPPPIAAYVAPSGQAGWKPLVGTGNGGMSGDPPPAALYVKDSVSGRWQPWDGGSSSLSIVDGGTY
jgi:hypothetical protein